MLTYDRLETAPAVEWYAEYCCECDDAALEQRLAVVDVDAVVAVTIMFR